MKKSTIFMALLSIVFAATVFGAVDVPVQIHMNEGVFTTNPIHDLSITLKGKASRTRNLQDVTTKNAEKTLERVKHMYKITRITFTRPDQDGWLQPFECGPLLSDKDGKVARIGQLQRHSQGDAILLNIGTKHIYAMGKKNIQYTSNCGFKVDHPTDSSFEDSNSYSEPGSYNHSTDNTDNTGSASSTTSS